MSTSPTLALENKQFPSQVVPGELPNPNSALELSSSDENPLPVTSKFGTGRCTQFLIAEIDRLIKAKRPTEEVLGTVSLLNQDRCEPPLLDKELQKIVEGRFRFAAQQEEEKRRKRKGTTNARPPEYSDDALAREFSIIHSQDLKYVATERQWFHWTGTYWEPDKIGIAIEKVRHFTAQKAESLLNESPKEETGKQSNWAAQLSSSATISAIERLSRSDPRQAMLRGDWDANPWILSTPLGVVDLKTGVLSNARPEDYCSKVTAVGPAGDCPTWFSLLDRVTGGDAELQAYLQRVAGYSLTGSTQEHALFFFYGPGGNGKSTFLETLKDILKDHAKSVPLNTLMESKNERHPADIASLHGCRMAVATETEGGRSWDETRIKILTGGDQVSARHMRQDFFDFQPEFKLLIAGNNKPHFQKVDDAIRRRIHLIPFVAKIANPDRGLREKLRTEHPGILKWAVEGAVEYQKQGLNPPTAVLTATDEYLSDEDPLGRWIGECCELNTGTEERSADLYASWEAWCRANGEETSIRNPAALSRRLQERQGITKVKIGHSRNRGLRGIRLKKGPDGCVAVQNTNSPVKSDLLGPTLRTLE